MTIEGEVARPGKYPLGENLTAASLVRLAGGFKRGAYTEEADLTRYEVAQGTKIVSDHVDVPIAKAMADEPDADVRLRDGDVLTIGQLSGWNDLGATIKVTGEVVHPVPTAFSRASASARSFSVPAVSSPMPIRTVRFLSGSNCENSKRRIAPI